MTVERHVLGLSGGKDSAALAIFMREEYPDLPIEYFFTDTGKELPEVYEFLGRLEGFLGKTIVRLNPDRDFDFWLAQHNNFLPSPRTRWCTRHLKIKPFEAWLKPMIEAGETVVSYVGIRGDEDRGGYSPGNPSVTVRFPFVERDINKQAVIAILNDSGLGLPKYYRWRSRSGCTFCFFQQKIEWVRLNEEHPEAFQNAIGYEKNAVDHGTPFTWSQGESLEELAAPARVAKIKKEHGERVERERKKIRRNPLLDDGIDIELDIDELYGAGDGGGACSVCHK
jgi:hypothetical protein